MPKIPYVELDAGDLGILVEGLSDHLGTRSHVETQQVYLDKVQRLHMALQAFLNTAPEKVDFELCLRD